MKESLFCAFRLWLQARKLNFPWKIKGKYIYAACCEQLTYSDVVLWNEHFPEWKYSYWYTPTPLRKNGDWFATYRCTKRYPSKFGGSDYACGDTGKCGDFTLLRIDKLKAEE